MDSVAFAFCDAVVGTIKKLPQMNVPFPDAMWNCALEDHSANRKCFELNIDSYDQKWFYGFNKQAGFYTSFKTLLERVDPKYLRIDNIRCMARCWVVVETSKDEFHMLLKTLQPFFNFPTLQLYDVASDFPESDLDRMLSSFAKINISEFYSSRNGGSVTKFAKQLMQQDTLVTRITVRDARDLLAAAIENYRATGMVVKVTREYCGVAVYKTSLLFVR